jgi:hypothetical protein
MRDSNFKLLWSVPRCAALCRHPGRTLAGSSILSKCKLFRCRNIVSAGLGAVVDKARRELGVRNGAGVAGVSSSLHAVAAVLTRVQPE